MPDQKRRPHALVVDDNPVILLHATDAMEEAGFCTFAVGDADLALDRLGEHSTKIAVTFIDVKIPGRLDGLGLARYVADRWPSIGIIISSSYVVPAKSELPTNSVFLAKPFSPAEIAQAIRRVMKHSSG